jgi:hypothetical protein
MMKWTKVSIMVAMVLVLRPAVAQADIFDITTLPGYGVATSAAFNFGPYGWAGWSAPGGKVVLGAKVISGDPISEFSAFRPAGPGEVFPHYTFGPNEYGFVVQNALNGSNNGVQFELYYADLLPGYTITKSAQLNYNGAGGYGGWSAPSGHVVSGGGFQFLTNGAFATSSQIALENSVWPHYTFGPNEQGWVVSGPNGGVGASGHVYLVSFDATASVPDGGTTLALLGGALMGLETLRRKFRR